LELSWGLTVSSDLAACFAEVDWLGLAPLMSGSVLPPTVANQVFTPLCPRQAPLFLADVV
jgi:hypothetical protein